MKKIKLVSKEVGHRAKDGRSVVSCPLPVGLAALRLTVLMLVLIDFAGIASAATNNVLDSPLLPPDTNPLQPLFDGLAGNYGWLTTVVLVIGSLRIVFKPIMLALENYVRQTPSVSDDERLARFEAGWIYKTIAFVLDFGASIKLPPSKDNPPRN